MTYKELEELALQVGFTHCGPLDPKTIELKPEVRDMCAACHMYDKRWSCPPGCGSLDSIREKIGKYTQGILLQSTGELEDSFDAEGIAEVEAAQKSRFTKIHDLLLEQGFPHLAMGAGCCTSCKECTYPDKPCRFPERMVASMEASGMVVLEVCKANGLEYYYGSNTMTYTSCILF